MESSRLQDPSELELALAQARKKLTDEEFEEARTIVNQLLKTHPNLAPIQALGNQIEQAATKLSRELFDQGVECFTQCEWDRAITFWQKSLQIIPGNRTVLDWIGKAQRKLNDEKIVRSGLLKELEQCGKMLSERNYVVAEEHLGQLKDRFTTRYRLSDLQRIYEALVVRTRVELEKEFEDLRSNIVDTPETKKPPAPQRQVTARSDNETQRRYMQAFEAGKSYFDQGQWHRAIALWHTAQSLNPHDINLTHWIALAENNLIRLPAGARPSPVRSAFVFTMVFVVTAVVAFLGYEKYSEHQTEVKNRNLIRNAIEHYRQGRLEESWKTLQIYVLHDPENESARTFLERVTAELNMRQKIEKETRSDSLLNSSHALRNVSQLLQQAESLLSERQFTDAAEKIQQAQQLLSELQNNATTQAD